MLPLLICQGKKGHVHIIVCMYTVPKYVHANQLIAGGWRGGGASWQRTPSIYVPASCGSFVCYSYDGEYCTANIHSTTVIYYK